MNSLFKPDRIAILILLSVLVLGSLLIYAFGALSLGALFLLWVREARQKPVTRAEKIHGTLLGLSAVWFVLNVGLALLAAQPELHRAHNFFQLLSLGFTCFFPPLVMAVFYEERKPSLPSSSLWGAAIWIVAAASAAVQLYIVGILVPWIPFSWNPTVLISIPALFGATGVFSALVILKSRREGRSTLEPAGLRRWMLFLLAAIALVAPLHFLLLQRDFLVGYLEVVLRSMPLFFVFVGTYYEGRFAFFDVFVKQGSFFFLILLLLTGYFSFAVPWVEGSDIGELLPYVLAVTLLPLALALPWVYRQLEGWLDRSWLGRRFNPEEAVRFFLTGLEGATGEEELLGNAQARLSTIFQAPARIRLAKAPSQEIDTEARRLLIPIVLRDRHLGTIEMGRRSNQTPYFSQDRELLRSLAGVLASVLENVRLLETKRVQERRERELRLDASRSELKALRAQINPHFLFNALNAIAALIPRDPERAEATIEQLAGVFRYTLTRSESEWARLEDELEFIRAYLEVERARYGPRLSVGFEAEPEVLHLMVPTMLIQTLVENAVKHGVAAVRKNGRIEVRVSLRGEDLIVEVLDNGPGFESNLLSEGPVDSSRSSTLYGLRNVRERLAGHFGGFGKLSIRRDHENELTIVSLEMPLTGLPSSEELGAR